jgi:ribosomal protein S8
MNSVSLFFSLFNASVKNNQTKFVTPYSKFVYSILVILRQEGVIFGFSEILFKESQNKKSLLVYIKYMNNRPVVKQLVQIYKPGRKVSTSILGTKMLCSKFLKSHKVHLQTKTSFFIIAGPLGMCTHYTALRLRFGGRLVCFVTV